MPLPIELYDILSQKGGTITTAQANAVGISNERLRLLANTGEIERVAHGVYISPDEFLDKMYVAQLRRPKIIYSHDTALFLHGLTDRDPISYTVTVPTGYNPARLRKDGMNVFTIKRELHKRGAVQLKSIFGNSITLYGLERTICDCIRSRYQLDIAVVTEAMKIYVKRIDKNLNILMEMAQIFHIVSPLRSYMDVLL